MKNKKQKIILFVIIVTIICIPASILLFIGMHKNEPLKEVTVEAGTKELKIKDFYKNNNLNINTSFVTDINTIDLTKVGDYEIIINANDEIKFSTLHVVDTTSPTVECQDIIRTKNYTINAEDFITSASDYSKMTYKVDNAPIINEYKDYNITIDVIDAYNNKTTKTCKLSISFFMPNVTTELGKKISIGDIIIDSDYYDSVNESDLEKINKSGVGDYPLTIEYNNEKYTCNITIKDTTSPTLELKEVVLYLGEKVKSKNDFIKKAYDASGDVTINVLSNYNTEKVGTQTINIEAIDINGNKTEKSTTLTIKKDDEGPVFSGLSDISIKKNSTINYESGVKAVDKKDGEVEFTVNSDSVKLDTYGTYYATYTATDSNNNKTTKKRKIIVEHDEKDLSNLVNKYLSNAGNDYESARLYVQKTIKYNSSWGGSDPVWYGLTSFKGNCYVHALTYKAFLDKLGYENKLIWTTDKTHYWNLVKINGVWRHSDSTPGTKHTMISAETDETRYAHLQGRNWDRSAWPEAK